MVVVAQQRNRAAAMVFLLTFVSHAALVAQGSQDESNSAESDSAATNEFVMTKSPVAAVLWGVIPGGGQVYTEQYWKVPLFALPIGGLGAWAFYNESRRSEFADQAALLGVGNDGYDEAVASMKTYRDRRDLGIAFTAGVLILSMVDAYVGAHLYDFDVGDSLATLKLYPDLESGGIGLVYRW